MDSERGRGQTTSFSSSWRSTLALPH